MAAFFILSRSWFLIRTGPASVRMGRSSTLAGAIVNDEVSHRVLSFAAPVLDGATRVDGRISVNLTEAVLPILAAPDARARVEGDVVFDEVRFMPGPLIDQLLSLLRLERKPLLVLRDSISVRVADRKVYQEGLVIPVGRLATIGLDGSVDFDKNLDLIARIAMEPPRSNVPVLSPIMKLARIELPIRGTLNKPKIDGDGFEAAAQVVRSGFAGQFVASRGRRSPAALSGIEGAVVSPIGATERGGSPPPPPQPAPGTGAPRERGTGGGNPPRSDSSRPMAKSKTTPKNESDSASKNGSNA